MTNKSGLSTFQTTSATVYGGKEELFSSERCLSNYNMDIVKKMAKLAEGGNDVLEFGGGIGTLALEWKKQTGIKPECVEIDKEQQKIIKERGLIWYESINDVKKQFDIIYTSNVLEHIEDDLLALKELNKHLRPQGRLIIYVPALMFLFSDLDRTIGHYRRYGKYELKKKTKEAGFEIVSCHYVDSIGFFASLALKIFGYKNGSGSLGSDQSLKFYDSFVYPISKVFDRIGIKHLFGKNLLLVAKKPARPTEVAALS